MADDGGAGAARPVDPAGAHRRHAVHELGLADTAVGGLAARPVHRPAFHEHRADDVVAAGHVGQQLLEQIERDHPQHGFEAVLRRPQVAGGGRPAVPQMVVRVDDRQLGLENGLAHRLSSSSRQRHALSAVRRPQPRLMPGSRAPRNRRVERVGEKRAGETPAVQSWPAASCEGGPSRTASCLQFAVVGPYFTMANLPKPVPETHAGWRSRGYLPHYDASETVQHVVFRLADSLPAEVMQALEKAPKRIRLETAEATLDAGVGSRLLADPRAAAIVQAALLHFVVPRFSPTSSGAYPMPNTVCMCSQGDDGLTTWRQTLHPTGSPSPLTRSTGVCGGAAPSGLASTSTA